MRNKFTHYIQTKRRLYSIPPADDWNSLLNYWGQSNPYPGYEDIPYPGATVTDPIMPYPGMPMTKANYNKLIEEASKYLGRPYVWGGKQAPNFDCSGFVAWCYKFCDLMPTEVVAYTGTIWAWLMENGGRIEEENARPGDICCWNGSNGTMYESNAHVGIYIGNGYIIDCSGGGVQYRLVTYHRISRFRGYFRCISGMWY